VFLNKIFNRTRSTSTSSRFSSWIGFNEQTSSGEVVTVENGSNLGIVFAAIYLKSSSIAKLPISVYKKTSNGRERDNAHRIAYLLSTRPNRHQSPYSFLFTMGVHMNTHGAAFIKQDINRRGLVESLRLMYPSSVSIVMDREGKVFYIETMEDGTTQVHNEEEVLFLPLYSTDGFNYKSPIEVAMENIGVLRSQQKFLGSFYKNGTLSRGVIKVPTTLNKEAKDKVRQAWQDMTSGMDTNASKVAVLDSGFEYQNITIPLEQAEFIASANFNLREIARIFNVPAHLIGDLERSTFNNIEHLSMSYVEHTLMPICCQIEQEMNFRLFTASEQKQGYYVKFNMTSALRADSTTRAAFYEKMLDKGVYSINMVLELEDENGIGPAGDVHRVDLNHVSINIADEYQLNKSQNKS